MYLIQVLGQIELITFLMYHKDIKHTTDWCII